MRNRTIIKDVKPVLDGGKYYIKRIPGEEVVVTAVIYSDSNDQIKATILYKKEGDKKWQETLMQDMGDDKWQGKFIVETEGFYQYRIEAWVDHLATWYHNFKIKHDLGQHLASDLAMGTVWLQKAADQANPATSKRLRTLATALADVSKYHENIAALLNPELNEILSHASLKQFPTTYGENLKVRVGRPKELFSTWYLMFPRSASTEPGKHGTLKDCERLLPRIAEFGFDVLFLPPIFPIGKTNRKGKNNSFISEPGDVGSPWSVGSDEGGHKTVNPLLGTIADFERLVESASKLGIEIALDMSFRCSADHPYVTAHPDWFYRLPDGRLAVEEVPPLNYQDIVDMNFECDDWKNLWEELKGILLFWAEKGVRIFYGSTPHYKPFSFWHWAIQEVQKVYPDVFYLSGAFARANVREELAKSGFSQLFTNFIWRNSSKKEIQDYLRELTQEETKEYQHPNFFTNTPDILPSYLAEAGPSSFLLQYALASTLSSNCGIYGPAFELMDNHRYPESKERYLHSEKYEIAHHDWKARNRVTDFISRMNRIRKENPALQTTNNIHFTSTDSDNLMSFVKTSPDMKNIIWCIVNLDPLKKHSGYVEIPKDLLGLKGRWFNVEVVDLLTGESYHWFNDWNFVELSPDRFPIHVLSVKI
jgi:starch synthase (maltosyl-transferring)